MYEDADDAVIAPEDWGLITAAVVTSKDWSLVTAATSSTINWGGL